MSAKAIDITVLMPVYNAQEFLAEAISSVLSQTYRDFEFLILNDGSADDSEKIILSYRDERIRYVRNESNMGLIHTLNKGLGLAKGRYIVRMDADDICRAERVEKQLAAFAADPSLVLCASNYDLIGGGTKRAASTFFHANELKAQLLFASSISHPTVMMLNPLRSFGITYHTEFTHCEDYRLWTELAAKGNFQILEDRLIRYRLHDKQITARYRQEQKEASSRIRRDYLEACGWQLSKDDQEVLDRIGNHQKFKVLLELQQAEQLLLKLRTLSSAVFSAADLNKVVRKNWLDSCGHTSLGLQAYTICVKSLLLKQDPATFSEKLVLLAKCLLRRW